MKRVSRILAITLIATVFMACTMSVFADSVSAASYTTKTTTATKTTTKVTNKKAVMKKAAAKTKSSTSANTKKYAAKTVTKTSTKKVVQQKTVKTTKKVTYKKRSKVKKIRTVKKTTVKTTTTVKKAATTTSTATVSSIKTKVTPAVLNAFEDLEFKIKINSQVNYAGVFSTTKHMIELKSANANALLHEMGHFLACLKNKADKSTDFVAIYKAEKDKFQGSNKAYVTSTGSEYFAESYKDYVTRPDTLKKDRPRTYAYINNAVKTITQSDIDRTRNMYSWAW